MLASEDSRKYGLGAISSCFLEDTAAASCSGTLLGSKFMATSCAEFRPRRARNRTGSVRLALFYSDTKQRAARTIDQPCHEIQSYSMQASVASLASLSDAPPCASNRSVVRRTDGWCCGAAPQGASSMVSLNTQWHLRPGTAGYGLAACLSASLPARRRVTAPSLSLSSGLGDRCTKQDRPPQHSPAGGAASAPTVVPRMVSRSAACRERAVIEAACLFYQCRPSVGRDAPFVMIVYHSPRPFLRLALNQSKKGPDKKLVRRN